jgi:hypothetical protein
MIRRLASFGLLASVAIVLISKARSARNTRKQSDRDAKTNWDSEGGSPAPDPVDTPVAG